MDLREIGWSGTEWIHMAQDRHKRHQRQASNGGRFPYSGFSNYPHASASSL
jgi:hypothetical protein